MKDNMKDLDISNIESKPTVVLVSNQSEYDQLMQHLEGEGCVWNGHNKEKPTEWRPSGFLPPYIINIYPNKTIKWGLESDVTPIPFQDYAAKHIKPKRKRKRIEKSKYDALMADLAQTSRYADELFQKLEQAVAERNEFEYKLTDCREKMVGVIYIAVAATICAFVLSMAVWMGALIPKI